ncbi:hypothetical protein TK90_2867 (plasmid) [Thioalkalivibrio sp. K90mix]|uniref:hypothetical protein n=1 Tax=Thioalkalivibrio sp. (strain K90mix) TaxID=396595 RepID=UPI000195A943|nr:hypothetical protein [Thioalkalivibrio sp. K90mix]ADC73351.1 hypothetical protein TK90_2867 [Thioalkalivibrio sp. K90mix]
MTEISQTQAARSGGGRNTNRSNRNRPTSPPELFEDASLMSKPIPHQARFASELAYNAASELLDRFENSIRYLYHFASNRLRYDKRDNRVEAMRDFISNRMNQTLNPELLQDRTAAIERKLEEVAFDTESVYSDEAETYLFSGSIRSPHGRELLEYIMLVDRYEALRAVAWMYGLVDPKTHAREHYRYKRSLDKAIYIIQRTSSSAQKRRINPLVDSGDFFGRTKAELKEIEERKKKRAQKIENQEAPATDTVDSPKKDADESAPTQETSVKGEAPDKSKAATRRSSKKSSAASKKEEGNKTTSSTTTKTAARTKTASKASSKTAAPEKDAKAAEGADA